MYMNKYICIYIRGITVHRYESVTGWINTDATTSLRGPLNPFKRTKNRLMRRFKRCESVEWSFSLKLPQHCQLISIRFHTDRKICNWRKWVDLYVCVCLQGTTLWSCERAENSNVKNRTIQHVWNQTWGSPLGFIRTTGILTKVYCQLRTAIKSMENVGTKGTNYTN